MVTPGPVTIACGCSKLLITERVHAQVMGLTVLRGGTPIPLLVILEGLGVSLGCRHDLGVNCFHLEGKSTMGGSFCNKKLSSSQRSNVLQEIHV